MPMEQLLVIFKSLDSTRAAPRASHFVGLRFAPASSKPGPAGERTLPSCATALQSHFVPPGSLILFPPRQNKRDEPVDTASDTAIGHTGFVLPGTATG